MYQSKPTNYKYNTVESAISTNDNAKACKSPIIKIINNEIKKIDKPRQRKTENNK